jgi:Tfp pilus assembly PilM family ATPase
LRYPTEGHDDPFFGGTVDGKSYSLAREWQAASHLPNEKDLSVVVDLTVRYSVYLDDTESLLFERKQKAVFQWDATSHTYKLDTKDSSLTQQELDAVYDYDTLSLRKFIQYNTQELRKSSNPFALELLRQAP